MPDVDYRQLVAEALGEIDKLRNQLKYVEREKKEPIAIIGMSCRFPGGINSLDDYWQVLHEGRYAVAEVTNQRWVMDDYYDADPATPGKIASRFMGMVDNIDQFDAELFGIAPVEAQCMDPQHRLFLHTAWEAIEHAGIAPDSLQGSKTAVFLGISSQEYAHLQSAVGQLAEVSAYDGTGNAASVAAGRLSYLLGLNGPSLAVDTACSSSLVAINYACQSLRNRESNMVITGGVGLILTPTSSIVFSKSRMLSPDGKCKTFDADADGYVRAEGCGVLVLKRLSDALRDGDNILALIRGTAVNQDGRSQGLTAPNEAAQERVIVEALSNGSVPAETVSYVEAHGTGTSLGDPIELGALGAVYRQSHHADKPLWVGSSKTNLGHMETAAGVGGLIKVVLAMQKRTLPAHLHFSTPNPHIDWSTLPVKVVTQAQPWKGYGKNEDDLIAGVSSFGFGGTNSHTILQSAPRLSTPENLVDRHVHLVNLSGKNEKALRELAQRYIAFLQKEEAVSIGDIAYTSNIGRNHFPHRLSVLAGDIASLQQRLADFLAHSSPPNNGEHWLSGKTQKHSKKIAFLFSGQGAQYASMGKALYETQPSFRVSLDRCAALLAPHMDKPLFDVMWGEDSDLLSQTQYTQPALFAIEYALAELWRSWGIQPAVMVGHSVGEYAAAVQAGVFNLDDACTLIAARGRLMAELTVQGAMLSVALPSERLEAVLKGFEDTASVAAINGPTMTVISGDKDAIDQIEQRIIELGSPDKPIAVKRLVVSHAFHSPLMAPMLDAFHAIANGIRYEKPALRIVSTLTGNVIKDEMASADYWVRHVVAPVLFEPAIRQVFAAKDKAQAGLGSSNIGAAIEIGPHSTLLGMAGSVIAEPVLWVPSLRRGKDDGHSVLRSVATLHQQGYALQWRKLDADYARKRIVLPTYPFQSKRFWLEHVALGRSLKKDGNERTDWLYQTDWQAQSLQEQSLQEQSLQKPPLSTAIAQANVVGQSWLVLSAGGKQARQAIEHLRANQANVIDARISDSWQFTDSNHIQLNPAIEFQVEKLFHKLDVPVQNLEGILFFADVPHIKGDALLDYQQTVCGGLLYVVQSLTGSVLQRVPRLTVISDVSHGSPLHQLCQTPVLGLAKVVAAEYPELKCRRIEILDDIDASTLLAEVMSTSLEDQVRYSQGQRQVARLQEAILPTQRQPVAIRDDATYLITGGLGGLGLLFSEWLASQGARRLALISRQGVTTEEQRRAIATLQTHGVEIVVLATDIADASATCAMIEAVQDSHYPLAGVIHAAGVIDDGVLSLQNWKRFANVFQAKLIGTWNLHESTRHLSLDFFALFSSVASFLGLPGQANYSAANTFLDAFVAYRRQQGLPVLTINWGPWAQTGMVASEAVRNRLARNTGVGSITPEMGVKLFGHLLQSGFVQDQIAVVPLNWSQIAGMVAMMGGTPPLLMDMLRKKSGVLSDALNLSEESLQAGGELLSLLENCLPNKRRKIILGFVREQISHVLGLDAEGDIELQQPLHELGLDSLMAVEIRNVLSRSISAPQPVSLVFDYPTVDALARHLDEQTRLESSMVQTEAPEATTTQMPAENAVAIIGMACRYPGHSQNPDAFWELLKNAVDGVEDLGDRRWSLEEFYDPDPAAPGKVYTRWGGLVDNVDEFDNEFFGIAPIEATSMDPQQRLLLETCWEAIEYAGYSPTQFFGEQGGVFVGTGPNEYGQQALTLADPTLINAYLGTGNALSIAAGRISYILGWQGPCSAVDTACSSSLVAIHMACQSLLSGESDMALAGGVNLTLSALTNITLSRAQMLSPDGRCKTFDASANGYVRSEGCGIVYLKRLQDAQRDNDNILAVIRGTAINQDGRSQGLTAPNGPAQEAVIRRALQRASVNPADVDYVEAHGTGTALGDPIEMRSLAAVYGNAPGRSTAVKVGSVKTNLGHTEVAAGIAGMIKIILSMQHQQIPAHLHLREISPHLELDTRKVNIPTTLTPWKTAKSRRLAAVSSFGFSGTNSHAIIEQAPARREAYNAMDRGYHVMTLSGKTPDALQAQIKQYLTYLKDSPAAAFADLCFTTNNGRAHFSSRAAFVTDSQPGLMAQLQTFNKENLPRQRNGKVVFLFSGQGSQYAEMGKALYESHPAFRECMDRCDTLLHDHLPLPLLSVLWGENQQLLSQTQYTQPALFAIEYALAMLWRSWGVSPDLVMGHSIGEYAAACIADAFSLQDGLKLIAARGRLMQSLPETGSMLAVMTDEAILNSVLNDYTNDVSIAGYNSPSQIVVSGRNGALLSIQTLLQGQGIECRMLEVSHAFHSLLMEPMLAEFEDVVRTVRFNVPRVAILSNLYGRAVKEELTRPDYWVAHVRQPVRFAQGMAALAQANGISALIEIGPRPTLLGMGRSCVPDLDALWLPSLRKGHDDWKQLLSSLTELYQAGADIDWAGFDAPFQRRRVVLPTYPFQRKRFWLGTGKQQVSTPIKRYRLPMLGERMRLPGSKQIRFESLYTANSPAYISDHKLFGTVVVPGASHVSLLLSAARAAFQSQTCELKDVCFLQPLVLGEEETRNVQLVMDIREPGAAYAELMSMPADGDENDPSQWVVHATGNIHTANGHTTTTLDAPTNDLPWDAIKTSWQETFTSETFYSGFSQLGYNLGEAFQWLGDGWYNGDTAVRQIRWPKLPDAVKNYQLYPGLVDAFFQSLASCRPEGADNFTFDAVDSDEIYIPFALESFRLYRSPQEGEKLWFHSHLRATINKDDTTQTGDIQLIDIDGKVIAEVIAIETRKASRAALQQGLNKDIINEWFYRPNWVAKPNENAFPSSNDNVRQPWIILGHGDLLHSSINQRLQQLHWPVINVVHQTTETMGIDPTLSATRIDCTDKLALLQAIQALFGHQGGRCAGIINLAGIAHNETLQLSSDLTALRAAQQQSLSTSLALVQAVAALEWSKPPRLYLISNNAAVIEGDTQPSDISQAALWGMARVIVMEHAELGCVRVDLDTRGDSIIPLLDLDILVRELLASDGENQIAIRRGVRYVERLEAAHQESAAGQHIIPAQAPYQVKVPEDGVLDHLRIEVVERQAPGPDDIEIRVRATALNFRDVLNALGMFKEFAERTGMNIPKHLPLGFDCAGEVMRIGSNVHHLQVGDEVFAATMGSLGSHVVTHQYFAVKKPANLSFAEAAAIPTVFLTVYYGLKELAQIKAGDRVLIHAAAGGVGLAAIQLCREVGAEIYATASPGKWEFLRSLGVNHVMNSRTLEFADQILALTEGKGVDIVLNSINGECIPKSLDILAPNGRFVEIGKLDIWSREQVATMRADVDYHVFDLTETFVQKPELLARLLVQIADDYQRGVRQPLPLQTFPMSNVSAGFRHLAQARNIGKVIITNSDAQQPGKTIAIRNDRHYLITGGLGALGLKVADSLARQGARHIILTSRRPPNNEARNAITLLERMGVTVNVSLTDIADQAQVAALIDSLTTDLPLAGIVHAAGVLDDGMISQQSWQRIETVMAPKMLGAWHLHQQTLSQPLDFFICFSSIASLLGSPGQGNYAAANAFLDGLMQFRRQQGWVGMSINWGPWAQIGMAASRHVEGRFNSGNGVNALLPEKAIEAFERALRDHPVQTGIAAMEWDKLIANLGLNSAPPYFSHIKIRKGSSTESDIQKMAAELMAQLNELPPSERTPLLIETLCKQIARVMGFDSPERIRPDQPLQELGLDSLMAVEMRNVVNGLVGRALPATLLFKYPTVEELAGFLTTELFPQHADDLRTEQGGAVTESVTPVISFDMTLVESFTAIDQQRLDTDSLSTLSDEDAAEMLARKLAELRGA